MWSKYTYVCDPDSCDALLEFTCRDGFDYPSGSVHNMKCPCGRTMQLISYEYIEPIERVTNITSPQVVKINSNPYN